MSSSQHTIDATIIYTEGRGVIRGKHANTLGLNGFRGKKRRCGEEEGGDGSSTLRAAVLISPT